VRTIFIFCCPPSIFPSCWLGCWQREKIDWQNRVNLIVGWCGQFLIFVVLHQFSQVVGEWLENQILIPDWTYFYCPGTTLRLGGTRTMEIGPIRNQNLIFWPVVGEIAIFIYFYFFCVKPTRDGAGEHAADG